jgi:type IV secretory pathway VirJ component
MIKTLTAAILLFSISTHAPAADVQESTESFGPFGNLHIYKTSAQPKHMTLLISGDGGWNPGVIDMARSLAESDSVVVGIDITHYIKHLNAGRGKCVYPAAHFEELSQYLQKKFKFPHYTLPVLAGYSSGAAMVYATLAQSPPNTFAGGISMGFCPDLKTAKPFCKGNGSLAHKPDPKFGYTYSPVPKLAAKLYVLQSEDDEVCNTSRIGNFFSTVNDAELVELPKVGHGIPVTNAWMPQFKASYQKIVSTRQPQMEIDREDDKLSDLPLIILPATGKNDTLVVMVSGDGGWAGIDKQLAEALNKDGFSVVGLNSLQYFWEKKSPDTTGTDLVRILNHYSNAWGASKFILIGYSRGADTLPFMTARLPKNLKSNVVEVVLLGLGKDTEFEFHVSDWVLNSEGSNNVISEVLKLKGMKVLCIYGEDEDADSGCSSLSTTDFNVISMKGGHHFGGDYGKLAEIILQNVK